LSNTAQSFWLVEAVVQRGGSITLEPIIRLWNAGAETIFGYPAAEALGHSLDLIIPDRLRARHWEGYRRVIATGSTPYDRRLLAVPALRKDGTQISLEFTVVIVHEPPGEVRGIAAVLRDVTERWQREKAMRARLAARESTQPA
jgi:PAS domain S-box-containing protein